MQAGELTVGAPDFRTKAECFKLGPISAAVSALAKKLNSSWSLLSGIQPSNVRKMLEVILYYI